MAYHDNEWGVPIHDDNKLFEFLILESAQAGLNWLTVLKKRENYRKAFDHFDILSVSRYATKDIKDLLSNAGIIRNRLKIISSVTNARKTIEIQKEFGSFDKYIWTFVDGKTIKNRSNSQLDIPSKTKESEFMSEDLRLRGYKFIGPTICYAFMQAVGMINDHTIDCFRYNSI